MQILETILNSLGLQVTDVFNSITIILLIFTFTLIGAYLHEVYQLTRDENDKIEINKVFVTAVPVTIVLFFFSDKVIARSSYKGLVLASFILGAMGYTFVKKFYNGDIAETLLDRVGLGFLVKKRKRQDKNAEKEEE